MGKLRGYSSEKSSEKLKILFCTNAFEHVSNGPAKFANLLACHRFPGNNHEVRILTEDCAFSERNIYKLQLTYPPFLRPVSQFIRMFLYHREAMRIRKTDFHFDVLVYNNALVGFLSMLLFRQTFGMINDYTNATYLDRSNPYQGDSGLKRKVFHFLEKWFCKLSSMPVITNSEFLAKTLSENYSTEIHKFRILRKGIEQSLLNQDRPQIRKQKIPASILFVKTNFRLAGLDVLAKAVQRLNQPVKLTIAGPDPKFHQEIADTFHSDSIDLKILGHISQNEVHELMKSHRIFCLPAYKEAFGVSILEALALGCSIVASNTGGIPEALGKGNWGCLFPVSDPDALADCLNNFLNNGSPDGGTELENHLKRFSEEQLMNEFTRILEIKC